MVDGIDIRALSPQKLRQRISLVFQDEALFSATIADNIRYGSPDASSSAIRRAAEMAGAAGFIERLPQGYSTMLGRRGTRLSVGQKQRVAIARALLVESDAVVLDEPTGPLDPVAESRLMATLQRLSRTRIVIIVAHREATLALCDKVYFMTDGHIRASGTHAALIKNCPAYQAYIAAEGPRTRVA
ncbi:MAG TPA: ABC transporter ATP-binding protein, partial [Candidatus Binataceae bacterium]|nr:ABC transporter ATP-binding protein [Candidatus Binataceae bacterium]